MALVASCAWQVAHVFLLRTSCSWWQLLHALACAEFAGHFAATAALASWQVAQLARAVLAGLCGS